MAGAPNPEHWAQSEVSEDMPQLARYLFLRAAWRGVVPETDTSWIDSHLTLARAPDAPGAGIETALQRLLSRGIDRADLADVVRVMQWSVLAHICQLIDDPYLALEDLQLVPELADSGFGWGLFELDRDGTIGRSINGLHESVLETDPSGHEMRPRR